MERKIEKEVLTGFVRFKSFFDEFADYQQIKVEVDIKTIFFAET